MALTGLSKRELKLFQKLHDSRAEDYKTFSKKDYQGVWDSIVDKYPESAHFVYELLQNADDAEASEAQIIIDQYEMCFKHNGKKHFDVSDVEDDDNVGDINSITGIGYSSKDDNQNKIGKFGVGFKAVFQYTITPEIYDDTFKFKIVNYIIPVMLDHDRPDRKQGETLFVFPYKDSRYSRRDILNRVQNLENPILFLRHLQSIKIVIKNKGEKDEIVKYDKQIIEESMYDDITLQKLILREPKRRKTIFLFNQEIVVTEASEKVSRHLISVGFYYDENKKKLITDTDEPIFCFFPTKEKFNTCFVSHAPFLLTDNRQNFKPNDSFNEDLIKLLAKLATSAVTILRDYGVEHKQLLIDDNIIDIIPKHKIYLWGSENIAKKLLYDAFEDLIEEEEIFLSRNKEYLLAEDAYICNPKELSEILCQEQLSDLLQGEDCVDFLDWELCKKITPLDSLIYKKISSYTSSDFAQDITSEFMAKQDYEWVTRFYSFLRHSAPKLWKNYNNSKNLDITTLPFRTSPIIKTQRGDWVQPYTDDNVLNVYLPKGNAKKSEYNFVNAEYLKNENVRKFFDELEIREPDDEDYIRSVVLEKYRGESVEIDDDDLLSDLDLLIGYWKKKGEEANDIIGFLKEKFYLRFETNSNECLTFPSYIYIPDASLKDYFDSDEDDAEFLDLGFYKVLVDKYGKETFLEFAVKLGVKTAPEVLELSRALHELDDHLYIIATSILPKGLSSYGRVWDYELKGFRNIVESKHFTKTLSVYIWNEILPYLNLNKYGDMEITYRRKYQRTDEKTYSISTLKFELKKLNWIYSNKEKRCSADNVFFEDLAFEYNYNAELISFLGIEKREKSIVDLGGTKEQQEEYELGKKLKKALNGLSPEEAIHFIEEKAAEKKSQELREQRKKEKLEQSKEETPDDIETRLNEKWERKANKENRRPSSPIDHDSLMGEPIMRDKVYEKIEGNHFFDNGNVSIDDAIDNTDSKAERNLKSKNTIAQESAQEASDQVEILELLQNTPKYTYKWFKLYMELMHANQGSSAARQVQLDFSSWEFAGSDKVLHLSLPNQPVPLWIDNADKVSITALSDKPTKIDGLIVMVSDDCVDISIEKSSELEKICASSRKIRLVANMTASIVDSLENRFLQLGYDDFFSLNDGLTKNIEFIYGPPGTGKTTQLVKRLHNIINESKDRLNILVLTPTNKAADVISNMMVDDDVCYDYLTRFGSTESLALIEDAAVVLNRDTFDISIMDKNIVVTTAARYAYDCFQPDDIFICDYPWDYIILDEASMIDIVTATFILHKGKDAKFIISGDPKQIQPVVQNDMPAYNIYHMVGLCDLAEAIYKYDRYPVTALTTQYRSVPVIGDVVSKFAYNGIVKPYPGRVPQKPLKLDGINIKNINFVGFDIVEFDWILGLNAIGGSAFHLYSALFTYNFAEYAIKQLQNYYPDDDYSIGIVCPYKAQADAIKQMLENRPIDTEKCSVSCGTVHGFQGDECDIMFVVMNPPMNCTSGAHINNENILNVAMSRARDYLFFVMPQGQTRGFTRKNDIGNLIDYGDRAILNCNDIENIMFGNPNYICSHTHVSCHMPVNVYCEDTAIYEVKISDDALDIKINQ